MTDHARALAEALRAVLRIASRNEAGRQIEAARAILAAYDAAPAPADWDDARVKIVYDILCADQAPPNPEEHWEGWVARKIVSAIAPAPDGVADGMRRAAEIAYSEDEEADREWLNWGQHNNMVTAQTVSREIRDAILAAIPTAGAWEPPADRKDGYECLGRCTSSDGARYWQTIYWQAPTEEEPEGLWNDTWGIEIFPDPTAFAPLPPAPAGGGSP